MSFASAFDSCFVEPTIYFQQEPYTLLNSIELFNTNAGTTITGFEVFMPQNPLVTAHMQGDFKTAEEADLRKEMTAKKKGVVMYRNGDLTWSGAKQGRKPPWILDAQAANEDIEKYRVK